LADTVSVIHDLVERGPVFVAFWDFGVVVAVVWVVDVWVNSALDIVIR
jgi:hypothetical protein